MRAAVEEGLFIWSAERCTEWSALTFVCPNETVVLQVICNVLGSSLRGKSTLKFNFYSPYDFLITDRLMVLVCEPIVPPCGAKAKYKFST